jgi:hypothetical protein
MAQADSKNSITAPIVPTRRRFLSTAAGLAAAASAAVAVVATKAAVAMPQDDSELVRLEEQIFEQYEGAAQYDDEILRLSAIWTPESIRRLESMDGGNLSQKERWKLATDFPECEAHNRLCKRQDPFYRRMDALIKQMFAMPAHTAEGRRAKVSVLLGCIMTDDWRGPDKETDYEIEMTRKLLIEFIGGEPGKMLRDQFGPAAS